GVTVYQVNRLIIVIVIMVLVMMADRFKGLYPFKETREIIVFRYVQFRDAAASQSIIIKNIVSQFLQVLIAFAAVQQGDAISVFPDDMRYIAKVVIKIPGRIVTSRCDHNVKM